MRLTEVHVVRLPIHRVPPGSPRLVVEEVPEGEPAPGLAFAKRPPDLARAGVALMLWIQVAPLDTPDRLQVLGADIEGDRLVFAIEHRDFEGILGANVRECGAVGAQLPPLAKGQYDVTLTVERYGFTRLDRPEDAELRERTEQHLSFSLH